jgi:hypothetical protein
MLARGKGYKNINLIDFSLSEEFVDEEGEVVEEPAHSVFKGSISFWSRRVLTGGYPCRRDDVESLIYSMMYILKGTLPWLPDALHVFSNSDEKKQFVIKLKRSLKIEDIFIGYPSVFINVYKHIEELDFTGEPDYEAIKAAILQSLITNFPDKTMEDWEPFKWKGAKVAYLKEQLDIQNLSDEFLENIDSFDKQECFVDSFANFKSFEMKERQEESIEWSQNNLSKHVLSSMSKYKALNALRSKVFTILIINRMRRKRRKMKRMKPSTMEIY